MEMTYLPAAQSAQQFETAKQRLERLESQIVTRPLANDTEYNTVGQVLVEVKKFRKEWDEATKDVRKTTKAAHAAACKMFTDIETPLKVIESRLIPFLDEYDRRKEAEVAKQEAKINKEVEKLNKKLQTPEGAAVIPLAVTLPKLTAPDGLNRRTMWAAKITDIKALCKAVAEGTVPEAYIVPNMTVLNMQARALKGETKIPGVVAYEERSYADAGR